MMRDYEYAEDTHARVKAMTIHIQLCALTAMDYSLRWVYRYSLERDGIICQDAITGAWYRVPGQLS